MIRLANLWKTYAMGGQKLHALRDLDLAITSGEHVAIMGPSGSGKSTLLNILGCLDQPSTGEYFLENRAVAELSADELADIRCHKIGFVFQAFHLIPRLDALANISIPMLFAGVAGLQRKERARRALDSVGLSNWANHRPAELSGGQKQRVAIARAIVMQPRLLLADEPTGNLDSTSGKQILDFLCGLNAEGLTLVTVTHDPNVARLADRVIVLSDGVMLREIEGKSVAGLDTLFSGPAQRITPEAQA